MFVLLSFSLFFPFPPFLPPLPSFLPHFIPVSFPLLEASSPSGASTSY